MAIAERLESSKTQRIPFFRRAMGSNSLFVMQALGLEGGEIVTVLRLNQSQTNAWNRAGAAALANPPHAQLTTARRG